jgi:L,D-peptidoglycan transpeptidase YkuD (ErfK/YbiS/YcfS/YnhG family)
VGAMRSAWVAVLGGLSLVAVLALAPPADAKPTLPEPAALRASTPARAQTVTLGGVHVDLRPGTRQVVTVNHGDGYHARVRFWVQRHHHWRAVLTSDDGRIGYGGLVSRTQRRQGTGTTPLGTFGIPFAFGMHRERASWKFPYRRVGAGDYWVEDNGSDHYNRFRNKHRGGFRWWLPTSDENSSERLRDYRDQYEWAFVLDFNWNQVRHRGAGIFLHVNGSGATAGCVSAPRGFIHALVRRIDSDERPVVAVGR